MNGHKWTGRRARHFDSSQLEKRKWLSSIKCLGKNKSEPARAIAGSPLSGMRQSLTEVCMWPNSTYNMYICLKLTTIVSVEAWSTLSMQQQPFGPGGSTQQEMAEGSAASALHERDDNATSSPPFFTSGNKWSHHILLHLWWVFQPCCALL